MEKTINCAFEDCGISFTYQPSTKYTDKRKYCDQHSAEVKASYKTFKNASESKPTHTPQGNPLAKEEVLYKEQMYEEAPTETVPVEKISSGEDEHVQIGLEFEIRSREVKCRALASAIEMANDEVNKEQLLKLAKEFEKYILGED